MGEGEGGRGVNMGWGGRADTHGAMSNLGLWVRERPGRGMGERKRSLLIPSARPTPGPPPCPFADVI